MLGKRKTESPTSFGTCG